VGRRIAVAGLLALAVCPLVGWAESVDIPALGATIQDLPVLATKPQVFAQGDGVKATVQVGTASLVISRLTDPLLTGDVRDPQYRKARATYFREDRKAYAAASSIGGHDSWTFYLQSELGKGRIRYSCESYVIVDQHLYTISAWASGGPEKPADFDAAVNIMAHLSFAPPDEAAVRGLGPPTGLLHLPATRPMSPVLWSRPWYAGVVDLEYSIDGQGRVRDIKETYNSRRDLISQAEAQLRKAGYTVDSTWEQKGYDKLRFVIELQFVVSPHCPNLGLQTPAHDPRAQETVVTCVTGRGP
jgi:hypothetical protein